MSDRPAVFTKNDADNRAALIWGFDGIDRITCRDDGGFDVTTLRGMTRYHRLNREGHAVCHRACKTLETHVIERGARLVWGEGDDDVR